MEADYYKNDLSVNDAITQLLGLNLRQLRRNRIDLLDEIERDVVDCRVDLTEARVLICTQN